MSVLKSSRRGTTLVEVLIYVLILSVLSVVVINLFLVMLRSFFDFRHSREIAHSASVALERMMRETRRATDVDLVQSELGVSPGRLVLQTADAEGNPATLTFSSADGVLLIQEEGVEPAALTAGGAVRVDNLLFRVFSTPVSQAVKMELVLSAGGGSIIRTENFYGTAVLRGRY